jgi:hypothetical protein
LTGSAASNTMSAAGNGGDLSETKGTFLLCQRGHFYLAATAVTDLSKVAF